jgi:hypothetical protein
MCVRESPQALRAFSDYLAQSPPRSLERLAALYQTCTDPAPPTRHLRTLKEWSTQHCWQERVLEHERQIAQEAVKKARQQRLQVARATRGKGVEALALLAPRPGAAAQRAGAPARVRRRLREEGLG